MKHGLFTLTCVQDKDGGYTVFMDQLPALVVEVETLDEAPAKIANALHDILQHGFKTNVHRIISASDIYPQLQ